MVYNLAFSNGRYLKKMPTTLFGLMEEAQRHTILEALYYIRDTCFDKPETRKIEGGPSRSLLARPVRLALDKGKRSVFE